MIIGLKIGKLHRGRAASPDSEKPCLFGVKVLKNKIYAAVRRNLEEVLEVKAFLKTSIGFKLTKLQMSK